MSEAMRYPVRLLTLLLLGSLTFPQLLRAQFLVYFEPAANLSYAIVPLQGTTVTSQVRVTLYNSANAERVTSQVIMGHRVTDKTIPAVVHESRVVSETGEAFEKASMTGVLYHCYAIDLSAHANAYNRHEAWTFGDLCTEPYDKPDPQDTSKDYCPVLLDLRQNGFHLSAPDPAVRFDINADGTLDEIAWTKAGEDDAFLCWDRNHNGAIDDGRELFGYATPLASGKPAKIGYRALEELDGSEFGGNQDGQVDALDSMFRELCAWVDANRDGLSQADEIRSLDEVGVTALAYDYRPIRMWDQHGNLFRYVSRVEMRSESGDLRTWPTYDVIFTEP